MQPAEQVPQLAQKLNLRLMQLVIRIHYRKILLALADAGILLVLGRHLRGGGISRTVLQFQTEGLQLLLRVLLLQAGDFSLRLQLSERSTGAVLSIDEVAFSVLGVVERFRGLRDGLV